jgi:hypothetical protein
MARISTGDLGGLLGVKEVRRVMESLDGRVHARCFGEGSEPTKRPGAFGIGLHVDDSRGVAMEGGAVWVSGVRGGGRGWGVGGEGWQRWGSERDNR